MAVISQGPVTIEFDDTTLRVSSPPAGRRRGGPRRIPTTVAAGAAAELSAVDNQQLVAALSDRLDFVDSVAVEPIGPSTGTDGRRGRGGPTTTQTARLTVQVRADENAVLLTEQDGYYSWVSGQAASVATAARRRGPARREVTFELALHPSAAAVRRAGDRGLFTDVLFRPVTALIFKFTADLAVGQIVKRLEHDLVPGLVSIEHSDPLTWTKLERPRNIALPTDHRPAVLLLVHGTFSSTRGAFGSLGATESGRAFLDRALAKYDAVLGFDHRTLSEDPLENATQLLDALKELRAGDGMDLDILTHSRGALVARSLAEYLAPDAPGIEVRRVIMVAGPNSGTSLASADNWNTLIDLYTNLAVAACRVVTIVAPQAALGTTILKESLTALSILVKALISSVVRDEGKAPGLAAQTPLGAFIQEINQTQPAQPAFQDYRSISSDFEVKGVNGPGELPDKLKRLIVDGFIDKLMGESNDLVVDVASMTGVDPQTPGMVGEVFEFGVNDRVYHTNYFLQPETFLALSSWLGVSTPPAPAAASRRRTRAAVEVPEAVDPHFVVLDSMLPLDVATTYLREQPDADYAIVRRYHDPHKAVYHYPFLVGEFENNFSHEPRESTIDGTYLLNESDAAPEIELGSITQPSPATGKSPVTEEASFAPGDFPWSRRQVVVHDGELVGVVPAADETAPPAGSRAVRGRAAPSGQPAPSRRRGRGAPARKAPASAPAGARAKGAPAADAVRSRRKRAPAETFFKAEMDDAVALGSESLVFVEVSLEELTPRAGAATATAKAPVDPAADLVLHIVPRANFAVVGDNHVTVRPPGPGDPRMIGFTVRAEQEGPGEIVVVAMQGMIMLAKLTMTPTVTGDGSGRSVASRRQAASATALPPPQVDPCDQLWIWENKVIATQTIGGREQQTVLRTAFDVLYQSESLDVQTRASTAAIQGDRLSYVRELFAHIENDWRGAQDAEDFTQKLRAYGGQLFDELVPEPIRKILWDNRDRIRTIQVKSEDPLIPWELVHLKNPNGKFPREERFLANMGLIRWMDGAAIAPRQVTVGAGRIRVLAPAYPPESEWGLTETAEELKFLERKFGAKAVAPSVSAVLDLIKRPGKFDLLHFAGHGLAKSDDIANAEIVVDVRRDDTGWQPVTVSSTTVEQFGDLRRPNGNRPLVFLNACQVGRAGYQLTGIGGFAQAFLRSGAGVFVSTLWSVGDEPARAFSEHFYSELANGHTIAEATVEARRQSRAAGDPSWLAYVVYGRPEGMVVLKAPGSGAPSR
jgi:hypothetical protein